MKYKIQKNGLGKYIVLSKKFLWWVRWGDYEWAGHDGNGPFIPYFYDSYREAMDAIGKHKHELVRSKKRSKWKDVIEL